MSETKYPPGGVLFINKKKTTDRQPDYTGNLEISRELLGELVAAAKAGKEIKMDISGWKKQSKAGNNFLSIVAKKPYEKPVGGRGGYGSSPDNDPF